MSKEDEKKAADKAKKLLDKVLQKRREQTDGHKKSPEKKK